MNKIFNEQGCKNLINAIYQRAAEDYILAVVTNDIQGQKEIGDFLVSGAYWKEHKEGRYIKEKCLKEIKAAQKFIDDFLESDSKKIYINQNNISLPVLNVVKNVRYQDQLSFKSILTGRRRKIYLCKK